MRKHSFRKVVSALVVILTTSGASAQSDVERILPSAADPRIQRFNDPNVVLNAGRATRDAPLVVFLPGTNGGQYAPMLLLRTIAGQGYRVLYLPYNNTPAVAQVCPPRPPQCSARFRTARVFGGTGPVSNPPAESIVSRLTAVLRYLDRRHPELGWAGYLTPGERPLWPRIVVSGLSQGAGMAAFIAKRFPVNRVVLFSSPWDEFGPRRQPAPWLFERSATPPGRWWAERHARENTTELLAHAYTALRIPRNHQFVFDGELPPAAQGDNPYHASTVYSPAYASQWRAMFGEVSGRRGQP